MTNTPPSVFQKIRKIQMHTTQLANNVLAGAWHSAFKGRGMEFEEVREYQTGDEIRSIDWNVTARMNHPYVKVFREERELTVMLLVDVSASGRFGSKTSLKRDVMAELGAVLAFSAIKNNDTVGLLLFSETIEKYIPPKKGIRHVLHVIRELLVYRPRQIGTHLPTALEFAGNVLKKSCICFLISDLLCDIPATDLAILAKKHDFIAIHVVDPSELVFPKMHLVQLGDLESGTLGIVDTADPKLQTAFVTNSAEWIRQLEALIRTSGADFLSIRTDQPYIAPMRSFFLKREIRH